VAERGRGLSSIGQAFVGLSGGWNRPVGGQPRGRGLESWGQAFPAGGGGEYTPIPVSESPLFRKWWYEEELRRKYLMQPAALGERVFDVMMAIKDGGKPDLVGVNSAMSTPAMAGGW